MNINIHPLQAQTPCRINNRANNINVSNTTDSVSFGKRIPAQEVQEILNNSIEAFLGSNSYDIITRSRFKATLDRALPVIMTPENFINKGRESKVYRISDKYVAKIRRGHTAKDSIHFYNAPHLCNPQFKDLKFYYGEPLIAVGNVQILRNATPTENFVHCGTPYKSILSATQEEMNTYKTKYLPLCSSLPQESFDEFAMGLKKLNELKNPNVLSRKRHYVPDVINPNNVIISENSFKIVDKLDKTDVKEPNSLLTMLEPLIMRLTPESYAKNEPELTGMRRNIFKKCLLASSKADLPITSPLQDEFAEYYLGEATHSCAFKVIHDFHDYAQRATLEEKNKYLDNLFK